MKKSFLMVTSAAILLLYACGGGGGGGDSTPAAPTAPVSITSANAVTVSGDVVSAVSGVNNLGSVADVITVSADRTPEGNRSGGAFHLNQFSEMLLWQVFADQDRLTAGTSSAAVQNESFSCSSGSGNIEWNDADDNAQISADDVFEVTFNKCADQSLPLTLDGRVILDILDASGDLLTPSSPFGLSAAFTFINLRAVDNASTTTINGALDFSINTPDGVAVTTLITGTSLSVRESGETETLSNFNLSEEFDQSTGAYSTTASGTLSSTFLGGSVSFATIAPFQGVADDFPASGEMLITGDNSSVRLIVLDSSNVRLEVDNNADGIVDDAIDTTWVALEDAAAS